jgi:DtxR family transcriptional regulator, Mn-dependent transcriptional regulator
MGNYPTLTPAQQDYLEAILRVELAQRDNAAIRGADSAAPGVRVTDIAALLGCRLPTVVRALARLREEGLVEQAERGLVHLTAESRKLARQLLHRHEDTVALLTDVLGVPAEQAEAEACLIEHGLSAQTAQRLHEFLVRWEALSPVARARIAGSRRRLRPVEFMLVGAASGAGGRR